MSRAKVIQKIKGQLRGHARGRGLIKKHGMSPVLDITKRSRELKARLKRAQTPTVKPKGRLPNPLFIRSQEQIVRAYDKATAMVYQAQSYERDGKAGKARSLNAKAKALYRKADKAQERLDLRANPRRNGFFDSDAIASAKKVKRIHKVQERNTKEGGEIIGVQPGGFVKVKWDNRERPTLIKRSEIKRYPYLRNPAATEEQYISRIKNQKKKVYAKAYLAWLRGLGPQPERGDLSMMGAQSVHLELRRIAPYYTRGAGGDETDPSSNPGIMELAGGLQALDYLGEKVGVGKRRRNPTITQITKAYVRTYSDSGQKKAYVEWVDSNGKTGRTEGDYPLGAHMKALFGRAKREGVKIEREVWSAKRNPSVNEMSERFQGRATGSIEEYYFSNSAPRLDMSRGGKLVFLKLKGTTIRVPASVVAIDAVKEKLWLGCKSQTGMFKRKAKPGEQLDYGDVDAICYLTAKKHIGSGKPYEYVHNFGENGGRKPRLLIDHEGMPILKGGDYKIEDRGIVN